MSVFLVQVKVINKTKYYHQLYCGGYGQQNAIFHLFSRTLLFGSMKLKFLAIFILISSVSFAQLGGDKIYQFLNLNSSARVASLGGNQIAVKDNDPFLAGINPALLNKEMSNKLSMSYIDYLADVSIGFASYTKHFDSLGTFNLGIQYVNYGEFIETDISGQDIGTFTAGEYAFILGYGKELDSNFSIGLNLKPIFSSFYDNQSFGLAADLGMTYHSEKRRVTMSLLAKNFGRQITTYTDISQNEDLPFELQFGISKRLSKVPLRLSLIAHNLQQWDLRYENPTEEIETESILDNETPDENTNDYAFLDNLARHLIFNAEFLVTENFNVRFGYNYLRRRELRITDKLGTVGMSWGFGMRVSKFHLSYGRSAFHQAGTTNTFSISTRLSDFIN